tara:strand:- start:20 stop:223 length:204 start_codon:yes stop_codon:yes gene_type:complete
MEVVRGEARFANPQGVAVDGREISARSFLLCNGAGPMIPPIDDLSEVDYLTYETVWDLEDSSVGASE